MTRDEFGGYCCKKWTDGLNDEDEEQDEVVDENNICALLGLDIDKLAYLLVKEDLKRIE